MLTPPAPRPESSALARPADAAVRGIVAANVIAIVVALLDGGGILILLWTYWLQSLVIGYYAYRRISVLQRFSTDGLKINGQAAMPTDATRRWSKNFFAAHYGFFHLIYFMFLATFSGPMSPTMGTLGRFDLLIIVALGAGFAYSHRASHREHVEADLRGVTNLGALVFLPYVRIVPMHITIILGAVIGSGGGVILFGALKTGADVVMHKVEHHILQRTLSVAAATSRAGSPATPPRRDGRED